MNREEQHERFERWISDYIAILHRTVNAFSEGEDRKDLMQNVLLALWKAIPSFREQAQPSTFIYRVAHNAALTWRRSRKNYHIKLDQYGSLLPNLQEGQLPRPVDHELLDSLYAAIRQLPPLDRSLALLLLDDVSYREMAEIHGLSENNVGVRLHRLKQKLALSLTEANP